MTLQFPDPMSAAELTALLLFCTAMSFSPGPNTTLSTALAANRGLARPALLRRRAGRLDLLMIGSGLDSARWCSTVPALRWAVKLAGVAYMLWLAWKLAAPASWRRSTTPLRVTSGRAWGCSS